MDLCIYNKRGYMCAMLNQIVHMYVVGYNHDMNSNSDICTHCFIMIICVVY